MYPHHINGLARQSVVFCSAWHSCATKLNLIVFTFFDISKAKSSFVAEA